MPYRISRAPWIKNSSLSLEYDGATASASTEEKANLEAAAAKETASVIQCKLSSGDAAIGELEFRSGLADIRLREYQSTWYEFSRELCLGFARRNEGMLGEYIPSKLYSIQRVSIGLRVSKMSKIPGQRLNHIIWIATDILSQRLHCVHSIDFVEERPECVLIFVHSKFFIISHCLRWKRKPAHWFCVANCIPVESPVSGYARGDCFLPVYDTLDYCLQIRVYHISALVHFTEPTWPFVMYLGDDTVGRPRGLLNLKWSVVIAEYVHGYRILDCGRR